MMTGGLGLRLFGGAALVVAAVAGQACVDIVAAQYVERDEKRFAVTGKPDLALSTFDGSIEVVPSTRPEVVVTIERHAFNKEAAARIEIHTEQNGNHIVVDVRLPKAERGFNINWNTSTTAKLIVSMPAAGDLQARSGDGAISVQRISRTLDLRSGDGSIHGRDLAGAIKVHTGDGSITLDHVSGTLDADTGDGSITVNGTLTSVRAHTGDGSVKIQAAEGSATEADWNITTGDGSVVLELPQGFNGELDAHTGDGGIALNDVTLANVTGTIGKNTVRGNLGSGGRAVRVRTGDGSITLRRF